MTSLKKLTDRRRRDYPYGHLMNTWLPLMVKRFRCGHEKTPYNTYSATVDGRDYGRCKICQDARQNKRGARAKTSS